MTSSACQTRNTAKQREKKGPCYYPAAVVYQLCWVPADRWVVTVSAQPPNSPLQQPITFHPALLLLAAYCGEEALHTSRQAKKIKENEEKGDTVRTTRESLALISKTFQGDKTDDDFFFFFWWIICCYCKWRMTQSKQLDLQLEWKDSPHELYCSCSWLSCLPSPKTHFQILKVVEEDSCPMIIISCKAG